MTTKPKTVKPTTVKTETLTTTNEDATTNAQTTNTTALIVDAEGKPKTGVFSTYDYPLVQVDVIEHGVHLRRLVLNAESLSDEVRHAAVMVGLKNKVIDAAAIARDRVTGKSATLEDKFLAMNAVVERLIGGEWNATAKKAARVTADDYLVLAIVEIKGTEEAKARAWVDGKSKEEKIALRKMEAVATKIAEIMSRGVTSADGAALLDELDAI